MSDSLAKQKWKKENLSQICVAAKKEIITEIKDFAKDIDIPPTKFMLYAAQYCMDNNIDLTAYKSKIWYFQADSLLV